MRLLADLGMSSMQVDDAERGFSYVRDGSLDMRMDRSRGRSAAQVLATISKEELADALKNWGNEPAAKHIAAAIIDARVQTPITTTKQLAAIIQAAVQQETWQLHPSPGKWNLHPAARTFQALRILVNRELANLEHLLRLLPACLKPSGRAAIISFHSGEDRLVKAAFRTGLESSNLRRGIHGPRARHMAGTHTESTFAFCQAPVGTAHIGTLVQYSNIQTIRSLPLYGGGAIMNWLPRRL